MRHFLLLWLFIAVGATIFGGAFWFVVFLFYSGHFVVGSIIFLLFLSFFATLIVKDK